MSRVAPTDIEILQMRVAELEVRLAQLEPPGPYVNQPVWKDVTAECEVDRGAMEHQGNHVLVLTAFGAMNHYRLTKISGPLKPHVAFIVEKRA